MSQQDDASTCLWFLSPELATLLEEEKKVVVAWDKIKAEENTAEKCHKVTKRETVQLLGLTAEQEWEKEVWQAAREAEKKELQAEVKAKERGGQWASGFQIKAVCWDAFRQQWGGRGGATSWKEG